MNYFSNKYAHFHRKPEPSTAPAKTTMPYETLKPAPELPAGSILLYNITPDEFYAKLKDIIKEILQQDQLLTKEGAMKMAGVSNATFMKAINNGIIKPQLVKGRTRAMYLESEVLKIEKKRKSD